MTTATEPPVVRLRPIVHATQTSTGVHLRGWASSFSMGGGAGVWRVWQALAPRLAAGMPVDQLCPAGAPDAVRVTVERLLEELGRHDMLVSVPQRWAIAPDGSRSAPPAEVLRWLEAVATRPDIAWHRLVAAPVSVVGNGPVAWAAVRALRRTGLTVHCSPAPDGRDERLVMTAGGRHVVAVADDVVGAVLPAMPAGEGGDCGAAADEGCRAVTARLGLTRRQLAPSPLQSLIGGAAAHRLTCAVAGLPDPGHERGARGPVQGVDPVPEGWRASTVLVARMDPLRAEYHPWLGGEAIRPDSAPSFLDDALARLDALIDPDLGPLEEHDQPQLLQVPAALGAARIGSVVCVGVAPTADVARVVAAGAATAALASRRLGRLVTAGATPLEATGRALRAVWAGLPRTAPLPEAAWSDHPAARRWWKALTLRYGVPATLLVEQLVPGVHRATVLDGAGIERGRAVEGTAGDAAAAAALGAVGAHQWAEHGRDPAAQVAVVCGATPVLVRAAAQPVPWVDDAWTWPLGLGAREPALAERLRHLPDGTRVRVDAVSDHRVADLARAQALVEVAP